VGKGVAVTINTADIWANIGIKWEVRDSDVLETSVAYLLIRTGSLVHAMRMRARNKAEMPVPVLMLIVIFDAHALPVAVRVIAHVERPLSPHSVFQGQAQARDEPVKADPSPAQASERPLQRAQLYFCKARAYPEIPGI
jgi:hypothetical protein